MVERSSRLKSPEAKSPGKRPVVKKKIVAKAKPAAKGKSASKKKPTAKRKPVAKQKPRKPASTSGSEAGHAAPVVRQDSADPGAPEMSKATALALDIAANLASANLQIAHQTVGTEQPWKLDGSQYDLYFEGALNRARKMIDLAIDLENREKRAPVPTIGYIHAEQLFAPDEVLSEEQISRRFKRYGWESLRSINSVRKLMEEILEKILDLQLDATVVPKSLAKREQDEIAELESLFANCWRAFHDPAEPATPGGRRGSIARLVWDIAISALTRYGPHGMDANYYDLLVSTEMVKTCINGMDPDYLLRYLRNELPEEGAGGIPLAEIYGKQRRKYNPHPLFNYVRTELFQSCEPTPIEHELLTKLKRMPGKWTAGLDFFPLSERLWITEPEGVARELDEYEKRRNYADPLPEPVHVDHLNGREGDR